MINAAFAALSRNKRMFTMIVALIGSGELRHMGNNIHDEGNVKIKTGRHSGG